MEAGNCEFELAGVAFDPATCLLSGEKGTSKLEPKAADVLAILCREQGRLVMRQRLLDECWGAGEGSDEALTQAVAQIRRAFEALGVPADFLTTHPKRGYRLSQSPPPPRNEQRPTPKMQIWAILGAALVACLAFLAFAPGYPRHAIRHALGLGPPHAQHHSFGN